MQLGLPRILSVNAGFMDTAAFLALKGLFTAHVTGNFVTLGASLVLGTSGALAKLLALPVFCIVVILARLSSYGLRARSLPVMSTLLAVQLALMILGAVLATLFGPFAYADRYAALVTGMTLVAAMAIQNAAHRVHLASSPPSTIMTGTTTQIMMDLGDVMQGLAPEKTKATRERLTQLTLTYSDNPRLAACEHAASQPSVPSKWGPDITSCGPATHFTSPRSRLSRCDAGPTPPAVRCDVAQRPRRGCAVSCLHLGSGVVIESRMKKYLALTLLPLVIASAFADVQPVSQDAQKQPRTLGQKAVLHIYYYAPKSLEITYVDSYLFRDESACENAIGAALQIAMPHAADGDLVNAKCVGLSPPEAITKPERKRESAESTEL